MKDYYSVEVIKINNQSLNSLFFERKRQKKTHDIKLNLWMIHRQKMARSTKSDNASVPFQYFGKVCWSLRSVGLHCGWKITKVRSYWWCWVLSDCRIVRTGCYVRWVANSKVYKNSWNFTYISAILLLPIIAFWIQLIFSFCFGLLFNLFWCHTF